MKNMGALDRVIRMVLAITAFIIGSLLVDGFARLALYTLSLAMIISSTTGYCLAYKLMKIDTNGKK